MKIIRLTFLLFMLTGCATSAVTINAAKPVPSERQFIKGLNDGNATVTIIRDSGILGSGCNINVYLYDELAATLDVSEKVTLKVNSGELYLGAQTSGKGLCFNTSVKHLETVIKQGQHKIYRVITDQNGNVEIASSGITKS
ncbi:hypothetical protein HGO26_05485 [Shewanella sp. S-1]|uniref:Lipoprotein n=1 Tax=Shewanella oncorhynchi TaxID=2726434 RepID=A0ABX1KJG4_9GAMM|nr:hypothetical protein [Shewanella oncorhynchi]NLQ22331.1 hypothetical protein [Shewanella oncorhynchi]